MARRRGELTWRAVRAGAVEYIAETRGDRVREYLFDLAVDAAEPLKAELVAWERAVRPAR